jgi:hypothetical protein
MDSTPANSVKMPAMQVKANDQLTSSFIFDPKMAKPIKQKSTAEENGKLL